MAKYKVNVCGFVSTFRNRNIIVFANSEEEAVEKAELKFIELQQQRAVICVTRVLLTV